MNGMVRKEKLKHEHIIRHLWLKMNYVGYKEKKKLSKKLQHHIQLAEQYKQHEKVVA